MLLLLLYLCFVNLFQGRSGRFGTKGLGITFVSSAEDSAILEQVQARFEVEIPELPDEIDVATYMTS